MSKNGTILTIIVLLLCYANIFANDFVPFVIPVDQSAGSVIKLGYKPLTEKDRLEVRGEKFVTADSREVRIWGVNLAFSANFPTHIDAGRIARRLASFGVNSVRFHHMDTSKWPSGIWDASGKELEPEALDRLDYFIDQLAECGIYANINLHVGKAHSKDLAIPNTDMSSLGYDKMISIFTPEIVNAQREYAGKLLGHVNKYRGIRYADDHAVAFVEITNENSLFMWSASDTLSNLPDYYARLLQKQYNQWLKAKYGSDDELRQQWLSGNEEPGDNILDNISLKMSNGQVKSWYMEQHEQARATLSRSVWTDGSECLKIDPVNIDKTNWHLQFNYRGIKLEKGKGYTVWFIAAADKARYITLHVDESHADWANLGLNQSVQLSNKLELHTVHFTATKNEDNARVSISFGSDDTAFYMQTIAMHPGVEYKMSGDESLEKLNIKLYNESESEIRQRDRQIFYAETEKSYFEGMYDYIKQDLGCRANVTGTIVFGEAGLWAQSGMDYIDAHAYWQHPAFPGKSWDSNNWFINQKAMTDYPEQSTLVKLSIERLAGKPFTVSEYNHPAPLDSQAECVPMIASWAGRQGWNGIWLYTYSHSNNEWDRDRLNSYFDVDSNPGKWGFMTAGALAYRDYGLEVCDRPLKNMNFLTCAYPPKVFALNNQLSIIDNVHKVANNTEMINSAGSWKDGAFIVTSGESGVFAGKVGELRKLLADNDRFSIDIETPERVTIMITPLPEKNGNDEYLITACGRCENSDMQFSASRNTVGSNWGHGPVQIEAVKGRVSLKEISGKSSCFALKPDGTISEEVATDAGKILLDPKYGTMWYLVQCKH